MARRELVGLRAQGASSTRRLRAAGASSVMARPASARASATIRPSPGRGCARSRSGSMSTCTRCRGAGSCRSRRSSRAACRRRAARRPGTRRSASRARSTSGGRRGSCRVPACRVTTGMPRSASARSSAAAPDHQTPLPATIAGRPASRSTSTAWSTSPAAGVSSRCSRRHRRRPCHGLVVDLGVDQVDRDLEVDGSRTCPSSPRAPRVLDVLGDPVEVVHPPGPLRHRADDLELVESSRPRRCRRRAASPNPRSRSSASAAWNAVAIPVTAFVRPGPRSRVQTPGSPGGERPPLGRVRRRGLVADVDDLDPVPRRRRTTSG